MAIMRDEAVIALVLVLVIASAGAGYYIGNSSLQATNSTEAMTTMATTTPSSGVYSYDSDINASDLCQYTNATLTSIISNIESYPSFRTLEGNFTYTIDGYGCESAPFHFPEITFRYYDMAHPITYQCPNGTATTYPYYQIEVDLNVRATGYDLTHSTYVLHPPTNNYGCPS